MKNNSATNINWVESNVNTSAYWIQNTSKIRLVKLRNIY